VEELLQKHRTFALSTGVGAFVFLLALLLRGCAVYDRNLVTSQAGVASKATQLRAGDVPDDKYLKDLDRVVQTADERVAALALEVGRTAKGEALWEECIADTLATIGEDTPANRRDIMERARRLPSAAFSLLLEKARGVLGARAVQAGVEVVQQDLGFEQVQEANFARYLAALAAGVRVVDRAIALGVDRCEQISVGGSLASFGGSENSPFVQSQSVLFKFRGQPAELAELIKSLNDKDARGRRLVLDEVRGFGRPETVRPGEPAVAEFTIRVFLVNLDAIEEAAQ
jgi:hypothetical protein